MTEKKQDQATAPVLPASTDDGEGAVENTAAAIQKLTDEAEGKGYFGTSPDETPRANYTVEGVVAGKPTPETTDK